MRYAQIILQYLELRCMPLILGQTTMGTGAELSAGPVKMLHKHAA